jgi:hypothetical protein
MNINDLRPASDFARRFGVKHINYGPPGTGKTPLINTAPRPVLLAVEPGLLSMKNSNVPTFYAPTVARVNEFFSWLFGSAEARNFDTVGIDSGSQICELILDEELSKKSASGKKVDGKAAYGEMSRRAFNMYLGPLYFMENKHMYIICKQALVDIDGTTYRAPSFPGKDLYTKVPHLYDLITHFDRPAFQPQAAPVLRTIGDMTVLARSRGGNLQPFEQPDLAALYSKIMAS